MITSQIDTAPKLRVSVTETIAGLITSQIDTAPKLRGEGAAVRPGLITSQIDTAPKRVRRRLRAHDV